MRVACPNCAAEYDVPESLLAAGPKLLRCARCGHRFQAGAAAGVAPPAAPAASPAVTPPPAPPAPPPEPLPPPPPIRPPAEAPPPRPAPVATQTSDSDRPPPTRGLRRHSPIEEPDEAEPEPRAGRAVLIGWVLTFAVLAAAGWAALHYQAEIVEAWPPAARLYAALGRG
jgi:predicted Zn finger-like uncharacterized protein